MSQPGPTRQPWRTAGWVLLFVAVIAGVFQESLFRGFSLVPTDLLHQLYLPYSAQAGPPHVKYHYCYDVLTCFYPNAVFWQQEARAGEVALWNPYILGGQPLLAASMQTVLSPFKLPYLVGPAERGFTLGIVLAVLVGGLGMFGFLRIIGRSRPAAFIGGCAFALSSQFMLGFWFQPAMFGLAPLVLWLYEWSLRRPTAPAVAGFSLRSIARSWLVGLGLGLALLAANIQASAHLLLVCGAYFAGSLWAVAPDQRGCRLRRIALILFVGCLVALPQWLPTAEMIQEGALKQVAGRPHIVPQIRSSLLAVPGLASLVFPGLVGSSETFDLTKAFGTTLAEFTGSIGLVPFLLFLVGAAANRDWRARALLAITAIVLVLLVATPLLRYLYYRALIVYVFTAAVLAAAGADAVLESSPAQRALIRRLLVALLVAGAAVAVALLAAQATVRFWREPLIARAHQYILSHNTQGGFPEQQDWLRERVGLFFEHYRLANPVFWVPLGTLLSFAAAWELYRRNRISRGLLGAALVALTVLDLGLASRRILPQSDLRRYPLFPVPPLVARLQQDPDLFRVHQAVSRAKWWVLPNSSLMVFGLSSLGGNESVWPDNILSLPYETGGQFTRVLDLLNVKYLVAAAETSLPAPRFELLGEAGGVRLYRNTQALPRLTLVHHWEVIPQRQVVLDRLAAREFDPRQVVFLDQPAPPGFTPAIGPVSTLPPVTEVLAQDYAAQRIAAEVQTDQPAVLVLADTFYPGWEATIDGVATPVYRADAVLRAVFVPAGTHVVAFRYHCRAFTLGAAIAGLTMLAGVLLGGWACVTAQRARRQ